MALPLSYHWRSLFARKLTTALTILVVAAVVGVFAWMIGFAEALRGSLHMAQTPNKLIVLKRGATSESNSAIAVEEYNRLSQLADVARDPASGEALLAPETMVQVSLPRLRDGGRTFANVAVRGVQENAFKIHSNVKPLGRLFSPGARELIVGQSAARQFTGLEIGQTLSLGYGGDRDYTVVGHFSAGGGPVESEIWGYLPSLMNAYNRTMYSSASLLLRDGADPAVAIKQIEGPSIQLTGLTEADYWQQQSRFIRVYLMIAYVLVAVMCVAAVLSIANTMFAAVAGRSREIAMLRTIGFSGRQILLGFVAESVMLSLVGGAVGCFGAAAWLALVGNTKDMYGASTFTTQAFEIRMTPTIVIAALLAVAAVGAVGSLFPAVRSARMEVVAALREP